MKMCDNKELLIGYVYDDLTVGERSTFAAHLHSCSACRDEVAGLEATRLQLAAWAPPAPDLGFQIVRHAVEQRPKVLPFRSRWVPAMGFAAAAVLVLAAASAIANLEVRYGNDGLVVRTGWARSEGPSAPRTAQGPAASPVALTNASADFALVEQRLRTLEAALAAQPASTTRMSDSEMLRQVRAIVRDAEVRQDGAVAQRLLQVWQDFSRVRQADMAMLQQGSAQYQGLTNAELARLGQALRVNQLEK
jgi:anti-sigma factor RsiW